MDMVIPQMSLFAHKLKVPKAYKVQLTPEQKPTGHQLHENYDEAHFLIISQRAVIEKPLQPLVCDCLIKVSTEEIFLPIKISLNTLLF